MWLDAGFRRARLRRMRSIRRRTGSNCIRVPFLGLFRDLFGTVPLLGPFHFRNRSAFGPVYDDAIDLDLFGIAASVAGIDQQARCLQPPHRCDDGLAVQAAELAQPCQRRIRAAGVVAVPIGIGERHQLLSRRTEAHLGNCCKGGKAHAIPINQKGTSSVEYRST